MTQEEKYNQRERSYSAWHRYKSTRRFVGIENAQLLSLIDLDAALYVEYDDETKEPLALIETARDIGQSHKTASVTLRLAQRADLPCYVVLYTLSDAPNPADSNWLDISKFRVMRLHPKPEKRWRTLTPQEWADGLLKIRAWKAGKLDNEVNIEQLVSTISFSR